MDIINITSRTPADPDPEGRMDMSPEARKKWIREHNPEEVAREKAQRKAMNELRQRIKEREASLSPEAKECWDAMMGRGYEDPIHDLRESIRQGIISRYNLREKIKALEDANPGKRTRLMREDRKRNAGDTERHSPLQELSNLKEDLVECEKMLKLNQDQLQELIAQRDVSLLLQEQEQIAYCLRLLYKFTADESVRQDIEAKTRARAAEWEKWKESEWVVRENGIVKINKDGSYQRGRTLAPKSYSQLADGIRQTLKVYEEMCNTYAKMPNAAVTMQEMLRLVAGKVKVSKNAIDELSRQNEERAARTFAAMDALKQGQADLGKVILDGREMYEDTYRLVKRIAKDAKEEEISQKQVALDFGVTTRQVKRWDALPDNPHNGCKWNYHRSLRTDPRLRDAYETTVGIAKMYGRFKARAKKDGHKWRFTEVSFVDNLDSIKALVTTDRNVTEGDLYEASMKWHIQEAISGQSRVKDHTSEDESATYAGLTGNAKLGKTMYDGKMSPRR